jgi:hypothetical protein
MSHDHSCCKKDFTQTAVKEDAKPVVAKEPVNDCCAPKADCCVPKAPCCK